MTRTHTQPDATGLALAIGAYALWGLLPLYIHLLDSVPALQLLSHRVLWSLVLLAVVVVAMRRVGPIAAAARGRTLLLLIGSALLIGINWAVYIWAVEADHVLAASLGYFINPLVNVALGVALLGERLRRWQGVAILVAAFGVLVFAIGGGGDGIGISLALALSFGFYGLLRKIAAIDALGGLTMETLLLAPASLAWLLYNAKIGQGAFGQSAYIDWLLVLAGPVTAIPLLLFAAAARRMPYATLGLIQYLAPTLQFLEAVLILGEPVLPVHIATFALIWIGCALYAWDSLRAYRRAVAA